MSPAITSGEGLNMPSKLRNLYQAQKPDIRINITSKQKVYTTLDRIEGSVTVVPPVDTNFDSIDIEFVGTSRTYVERLTTAAPASGRSEAFHQFLKLQQPGLPQQYPEDLVLKAGKIYEFPFVFVVPQQLLPRVCRHTVQNDIVREAHLRLPPTFNDSGLANSKNVDDMAPDMASIRYGVFAKITELRTKGDEVWRSTIAVKARRLRIMPAREEQPPLDVHVEDGEYIMRKEKSIRKGLLKGKLGTLTMTSAQPQSFKMKSFNNPDSKPSTMATVMLRFDPLEEGLSPPKLGNLTSKLKATTFFSSTARNAFPTKKMSMYDMTQGLHSEQVSLSSRCVANVEWTKHDKSGDVLLERRDSTMSNSSLETGEAPQPSEGYKGGCYYTARVIVPITLPSNKAWVPSFHTCLVSRTYTLKLDLALSSVGIGPSMELKLPVQISSEELISDDFVRRGSVGVEEPEFEVDDVAGFFSNMFEPRTIRAPSEGFVGRSRIGSQAPVSDAPPDYSAPVDAVTARMTHHNARSMSVPVY